MTTVDQVLLNIVKNSSPSVDDCFSKRDARILKSLSSIISGPQYITENQSRLLVKILKENSKKMPEYAEEIDRAIDASMWARQFRQVEVFKRIGITKDAGSDEPVISIEFTFSGQIRKTVQELAKHVSHLVSVDSGKSYQAELTEKNIVRLLDGLAPYNFTVDENLKNHYDTIKSWSKSEVESQFALSNISHQNFQKHITADLGLNTAIDENIIVDRSMRYQFIEKKSEKNPENLVNLLANRSATKVWVDKNKFSLDQVVKSLVALRRLPLMVIFDANDSKKTTENLKILAEILAENNLDENVGIYFRLNNDDTGKDFNNLIKDRNFNRQLDSSTQIVGVQSGKIPKFLVNVDWKPMSVLSLSGQPRHSKTAVYASCCDLIITYSDMQPIIENKVIWE